MPLLTFLQKLKYPDEMNMMLFTLSIITGTDYQKIMANYCAVVHTKLCKDHKTH